MKKIGSILNNLKSKSEFRKLNTNDKILKLISLLPISINKGIKFAYIKNSILFFVLTHPVYKAEFQYKVSIIKSLLSKVGLDEVNKIEFFVSNRIDRTKNKKEIIYEKYKERSHAIFANNVKDKKLYKLFEEIRETIKKNS
jgi:hypothetical protein